MTPAFRPWLATLCAGLALAYLVTMVVTGARPRQAQFVAFEAAGVLTHEPDEIGTVRIAAGGQAWTLTRHDGDWVVGETALPAATARQLVLALKILHTSRPVRLLREPDLDARAADYGLDRPTHVVEVAVAGQPPLKLAFGGHTPDGALRYMRIEGQSAVYLVSNFVPDEWRALAETLRAAAPAGPAR